jgi:hypothetical protein
MKIDDFFPSKFVKALDLNGKEVTVTIKRYSVEKLGRDRANVEDKLILWFEKTEKGLILNRTNAVIIGNLYGPEMDEWSGKRIILYATRIRAFGESHNVIRVKEVTPPAKAQDSENKSSVLSDPEDILDHEALMDETTGSSDFQPSGLESEEESDADADALSEELIKMWEIESPPSRRLKEVSASIFGEDVQMAERWIVKGWTKMVDPSHVLESESALSDDQRDLLADYLKENSGAILQKWPRQKAILLQNVAQPTH